MTTEELKNNFTQTITVWENALNNYTSEQLLIKESAESWSMGQVNEHLTSMTRRILILVERLNHGNENSSEEKTTNGIFALKHNSLGNGKIHSPANAKNPPAQPISKEQITKDLVFIKNRFFELCDETTDSVYNGKFSHAILGFLNAREWLQFIDMHFRHHLMQKERIGEFLRIKAKAN